MTYQPLIGMAVCNDCHRAEPHMIEAWYASGLRHYCQKCWPLYRNYYEDESRGWKRVENRYVPHK
jgi:hypothetical protein